MSQPILKARSVGLSTMAAEAMVKILQYPNELLKTKCETGTYTQNLQAVHMLKAALATADASRTPLGLSANQVGITDARVFVTQMVHLFDMKHDVFIDPVITSQATLAVKDESCMSFPDEIQVPVRRFNEVIIEFSNLEGHKFKERYIGLTAQVMQHEIDHLDGITLFQHATPKLQKQIFKEIERERARRR